MDSNSEIFIQTPVFNNYHSELLFESKKIKTTAD